MTTDTDHPWEPDPASDAGYALFAKDRRVVADDATPIAYTVRNPDGRRIPVLLANGWSCSDAYWVDLVPELVGRDHPVVVVDTRGHGRSGLPRPPGRGARALTIDDLSMARIARDLVSVLDDAGIERALVVGHSMGVQTGLEVYRQVPDRVAGLVLLAGTFENPAKTFYGSSVGDTLFPLLAGTMRWFPEIVKPVQATIGPASVGHFGARLARAAGPKATPAQLHPYLLHLKGMDLAVLMLMAGAMRDHSAEDLLDHITAPTLIVAAGADVFTPARCSEAMHHRIAASELLTFPTAGHTLPVEEPEAIGAAIDDFVARRITPHATARRSAAERPPAKQAAKKAAGVKKAGVKKAGVKKAGVKKAGVKKAARRPPPERPGRPKPGPSRPPR